MTTGLLLPLLDVIIEAKRQNTALPAWFEPMLTAMENGTLTLTAAEAQPASMNDWPLVRWAWAAPFDRDRSDGPTPVQSLRLLKVLLAQTPTAAQHRPDPDQHDWDFENLESELHQALLDNSEVWMDGWDEVAKLSGTTLGPTDLALALATAVQANSLDDIRRLLADGAPLTPVHAPGFEIINPLGSITSREAAQLLLDAGARPVCKGASGDYPENELWQAGDRRPYYDYTPPLVEVLQAVALVPEPLAGIEHWLDRLPEPQWHARLARAGVSAAQPHAGHGWIHWMVCAAINRHAPSRDAWQALQDTASPVDRFDRYHQASDRPWIYKVLDQATPTDPLDQGALAVYRHLLADKGPMKVATPDSYDSMGAWLDQAADLRYRSEIAQTLLTQALNAHAFDLLTAPDASGQPRVLAWLDRVARQAIDQTWKYVSNIGVHESSSLLNKLLFTPEGSALLDTLGPSPGLNDALMGLLTIHHGQSGLQVARKLWETWTQTPALAPYLVLPADRAEHWASVWDTAAAIAWRPAEDAQFLRHLGQTLRDRAQATERRAQLDAAEAPVTISRPRRRP